jgi:hypothetical protein
MLDVCQKNNLRRRSDSESCCRQKKSTASVESSLALARTGRTRYSGEVVATAYLQCGILGAVPAEELNLRSVFSAHPGREWRLY